MLKMMRIVTVTIVLLCACVTVSKTQVPPYETKEELTARIDRILAILDAINMPGRPISKADVDNLKKETGDLGKKALVTYLAAMNETLIAAETEGKKGDRAALGTMEDTMKFLADKARNITAALKNIQEKIRNGQLLLRKDLLPRVSDQDLRNAIDDGGLEVYRQARLLSDEQINRIKALTREQYSSLSIPCLTCDRPTPTASTFFRSITDALIPSAYADLAQNCIVDCTSLTTAPSDQRQRCAICCRTYGGQPAIDELGKYYDCVQHGDLGPLKCIPSFAQDFLSKLA
jgi:hypothetical protein